jgi:Flp pilus assembly protein CpaB
MPITSTQLAPGAISDASLLTGKVAAANILPGQQLTLADFSGVSGVSGTLAPNMRAVSISVGAANGDSAVVAAGDHVDIYNLMTALTKAQDGTPSTTVFLLASNVQVLKSPGASGGVLVLAVTARQAPELDWAVANGSLYLSLRPVNASAPPATPTTLQSVLADSNGGAYSSSTGTLGSQGGDGK